jgi:hypothetical protein
MPHYLVNVPPPDRLGVDLPRRRGEVTGGCGSRSGPAWTAPQFTVTKSLTGLKAGPNEPPSERPGVSCAKRGRVRGRRPTRFDSAPFRLDSDP